MSNVDKNKSIPGTILFDGNKAMLGYGLNKMCFSLNTAAGREEFAKDEMAYCKKFGLTEDQQQAIKERNVIRLLELGGSIYYLAKFTGSLGLNMQDVGAIQTGLTVDEFKAKLLKAAQED